MTSETSTNVFQDFCQAWSSRFPESQLPDAWEEDVRANLKKHKNKVAALRIELEKEEMYVEYLNKLLKDIELHRIIIFHHSVGFKFANVIIIFKYSVSEDYFIVFIYQ